MGHNEIFVASAVVDVMGVVIPALLLVIVLGVPAWALWVFGRHILGLDIKDVYDDSDDSEIEHRS